MCCFCGNYIMFEPEKYSGVKCHNTEEWCEIEEELNCALKSDMGNLANFELTLECLKICTFEKFALLGSFWEKYIMSELLRKVYNVWAKKIPKELCVMRLKGDAIFKEKFTSSFEKWHKKFD